MKFIKKSKRILLWLKHYIRYFKTLRQIPQRNITNKTIVINFIRTISFVINKELFIGFVLAKQGVRVLVLIDDGVLEHWDSDKAKNHLSDKEKIMDNGVLSIAGAIIYKLRLLIKSIDGKIHKLNDKLLLQCYLHPNITFLPYSKMVDRELLVIQEIHFFKGFDIDCAEFALQSTKKYFENSEVDLSIPIVKHYYDQSLINANISLAVGKYIVQVIKPDIFITSHGIYSLWGACYENVFNANLNVIVWGGDGNYRDRIRMVTNKHQQFSYSTEWREYSSIPVSTKMSEEVNNFLKQRTEFKLADTSVIYKNVRTDKTFKRSINNKLVVCAFPNVSWDGDIKERNRAFNGLLDWLEKTIEYFLHSDRMVLFIKAHPSEQIPEFQGGSYPILDILNQRFPNLKNQNNIKLIPADAGINTYEFIKENVDIGLVYDGHLCLELPYLGIPAIVAGNGKFFERSINFCVSSYREYIDLLDHAELVISDFRENYKVIFDNLVRYCYWYFKETSFYLPTGDKENIHSLSWLNLRDLDIGKNPDFKRTIERIIGPVNT